MGLNRSRLDEYEVFVEQSLGEYRRASYDTDDPPPTVWFVPTSVLYDTYCQWMSRNAPAVYLFGERQFGQAVQRVLGLFDERRQASHAGRRVWGYTGIRGPGAFQVPSKRGRRHAEADKAAAPSSEARGDEADPE